MIVNNGKMLLFLAVKYIGFKMDQYIGPVVYVLLLQY